MTPRSGILAVLDHAALDAHPRRIERTIAGLLDTADVGEDVT